LVWTDTVVGQKRTNSKAKFSPKRKWMKLLLGLNAPIDVLNRRLGFKISNFKFALFSEKELQSMDVNISCHAGNACATVETTSGICCDLGGLCL
jgi:hypothetical protein